MESNLQQQRQSIKKEEQTSPDIQMVTENAGQKVGICPNWKLLSIVSRNRK